MIRFLKKILGIKTEPVLTVPEQMAILEAKELAAAKAFATKKEPIIVKKEDIVQIPSKTEMSNMNKAELEEIGRTLGVELDKRLKKEKLIDQLHNHMND